jgi:Zn finger protein HypA/HybF involved in hydrogenase expression
MSATITLRPGQRDLLAQALADAVYYRDPPVYCPACEAQENLNAEDVLCPECAATLARASAYLDLHRALGLEAPA